MSELILFYLLGLVCGKKAKILIKNTDTPEGFKMKEKIIVFAFGALFGAAVIFANYSFLHEKYEARKNSLSEELRHYDSYSLLDEYDESFIFDKKVYRKEIIRRLNEYLCSKFPVTMEELEIGHENDF